MTADNVTHLPVRTTPDGFATEDEGYSPDRVYAGSTDKKGRSHTVRVNIPPAQAQEIQALVQQRVIPEIRTINDFLRDAIHHRLHYIANHMDTENSRLRAATDMWTRLGDMDRQLSELEAAEDYAERIMATISKAASRGDRHALEQVYVSVTGDIDKLREPYRQQVRALVAPYAPELAEMWGLTTETDEDTA